MASTPTFIDQYKMRSLDVKRFQRSRDSAFMAWLLNINNGADCADTSALIKEAGRQIPLWATEQKQVLSSDGIKEQDNHANYRDTLCRRLHVELLEIWTMMIRKLGNHISAQITEMCEDILNQNEPEVAMVVREAADKLESGSRERIYNEELTNHLSRIRDEIQLHNNNGNGGNTETTIITLNSWLNLLKSFAVFVDDCNAYATSLQSSMNMKTINHWQNFIRKYRYLESRITYEVEDTEEEITSSTQTMTSSSSEVRKRFVISAVVHPGTGQDISLKDAIGLGVINQGTGEYVNSTTGERMPIQTAMSSGLIRTELA